MDRPNNQPHPIEESLLRIPFFSALSGQTLAAIAAKLKQVHFGHGQVVFAENSLGDAMYLIESGQVKVSVNTGAGQREKIINYLGPGNFFGEMALLLNQRRSATVTVTLDADLWVLSKADLDELLIDHPEIAIQITRELSRRLSDVVTEAKKRAEYSLVAVLGQSAWRLAENIHRLTRQRVVLLDATGRNLSKRVDAGFQSDDLIILEVMPNLSSDTLVETLSILLEGYDWVLIALNPGYSETTAKALQLAKAAVLLNTPQEKWMVDCVSGPIFTCDLSETEIGRVSRHITNRVVGLALSSGGARGIAHVGVLQVLQEANIPIDMIAGTSAGSLFGGLYVCNKSLPEMVNFAKNLNNLIDFKSRLWDPKLKLPWNGLIKGNATLKYLARQFNEATFADTAIPFYVVAADVVSGKEVVFEEGSLAEAVRASIGIIGIFSPYQHNGYYLIDGGAVNPVPANILVEKGANVIIASSVIPPVEKGWLLGHNTPNQSRDPSFLSVLGNMMAIMEREIIKTRMNPVDVLIQPRVEIYTSMDYDKAEDFIRLGRTAAERELPRLQNLLNN
ncbi:MAG: patatin-like phospholipase family protein [Anaerolineae bacterium]|nr:patatin-like phospholipase family protein [Anaerolineae bacterium]